MHIYSGEPLYNNDAWLRQHVFYPPPYWSTNGGGSWAWVNPWLYLDGDKHGGSLPWDWRSKIVAEMNNPSPLTVSIWGNYSSTDNSGVVYAKFRNDSAAAVTGRIRFVLTEDSVYYEAANTDKWHNHVARQYLPDTSGTDVSILPGDSVVTSRAFSVDSAWNEDRCGIVTWIQSNVMLADSTKDVWQAGKIEISQLTPVFEEPQGRRVVPFMEVSPNPAAGRTAISFTLEPGTLFEISVRDVAGKTVMNEHRKAKGGPESISWDERETLPGVYFLTLRCRGRSYHGKLVVVR